ncbi:MAG: PH domain-containing protein [Blastococcus sp.]|nr:PH domain-containing protein [Blastococcus sp.]
MTSRDVVVELRPLPVARAASGVALVAAVLLIPLALAADLPVWLAAALVALAVGGGAYAAAGTLSHTSARADGWLEVRNRLTTHRLQRSDIERVSLAWTMGVGSNRRLVTHLKDGATVPLAATETLPLPRQRRALEEQSAELRHWLRDDRSL